MTNYDTGVTYQNALNVSNTVSSEPIVLGERYDNSYTGQSYEAYWDWIRVRKYASSEPTISIGNEELGTYHSYEGYASFSWSEKSSSSPIDISNLPKTRYIQYRVIFERVDSAITPKLNYVSITTKEAIPTGSDVEFQINWFDEDSSWIDETTGEEKVRIYICSTSNITSGGCESGATTYCLTTNSTQNPINCSYNTSSTGTFNYYIKIFDDEDGASIIKNGSFSVE